MYEVHIRYYESMGRTRLEYNLYKDWVLIAGHLSSIQAAQIRAGELEGETAADQATRYDRRYRYRVERSGMTSREFSRGEVIELLAGQPIRKMDAYQKEASMEQMRLLELHREITVQVDGDLITVWEIEE